MTNTGGELAMNHNLTTFSSDTLYSTYQTESVGPYLQGEQVYTTADGQTVVLQDQQLVDTQRIGQEQSMSQLQDSAEAVQLQEQAEEPTIDIVINNVVSSFTTRCHLDLKKIAQLGCNVMYRRENGMVSMKIRRPYTTASIWSSGKITCTGARSEEEAKIAARRFARLIQNLGYRVRFCNFRVVNVLGTCSFPFGIRITHFSRDHKDASYEPELHPGVTYKIKPPNKATLKIFSTGSITVTAPSVKNVQLAIEHIFPLVAQYRMDDNEIKVAHQKEGPMHMMPKSRRPPANRYKPARALESDEDLSTDEDDEDDFDSEDSQD